MAEQQLEPLGTKEYSEIGKALWDLVNQYPIQEGKDPDVVAQYDGLEAGKSLSVSIIGGGRKPADITGAFIGKVNFEVSYKSNPTTSGQRINAQDFVDRIMQWLESAELPLLTDGRTILSITASNAIPYLDKTGQDKSTVYAADAVMEYRKRGNL